jgi:hypothetical protein
VVKAAGGPTLRRRVGRMHQSLMQRSNPCPDGLRNTSLDLLVQVWAPYLAALIGIPSQNKLVLQQFKEYDA